MTTMSETMLGDLIIGIGFCSILGYLILQPMLAYSYAGRWRLAAFVPLIVTVPLIAHAIVAATQGSNLWPIGLIFLMPIFFLYLVVLALVRRWAKGNWA